MTDDAHGLKIQLATALRERDEALKEVERVKDALSDAFKEMNSGAERRRANDAETAVLKFEEERDVAIEARDAAQKERDAARAEMKRMRQALQKVRNWKLDDGPLHVIREFARAALATGGDRG